MKNEIIDAFVAPEDEFRAVVVTLIRTLDLRPEIKIGDSIKFEAVLTKMEGYNYLINDVNLKKAIIETKTPKD